MSVVAVAALQKQSMFIFAGASLTGDFQAQLACSAQQNESPSGKAHSTTTALFADRDIFLQA